MAKTQGAFAEQSETTFQHHPTPTNALLTSRRRQQSTLLDAEHTNEDSNFKVNSEGIVTHADDAGKETAVFLEEPQIANYSPYPFVVQSNAVVDRLIAPDIFNKSQTPVPMIQNQFQSSDQIDIPATNFFTPGNGIGNTLEDGNGSVNISVSNMEGFPFTLTIESNQD